MTIRERLVSLLGFAADKNSIDGALIDAGLNGALVYGTEYADNVKTCAISLLNLLLTTPDQTNENGFVIKYDRKAVATRIQLLEGQVDDVIKVSVIRNASYKW